MYNPKVYSAFLNLEKQAHSIRVEIDSFVGNISQWADGLVEIIEKEFTADKDSALFMLPKTPSEMKSRKRKGRNELVSKCSVVNSTSLSYETNNLNETISARTRGARRMVTSKLSQLNVTKDMSEVHPENPIQGSLIMESNAKGETSNATFVLPNASTRTKPVLKNKKQETPGTPEPKIPEADHIESDILNKSNNSSEKDSSPKKVFRTGVTPPECRSRHTISKTSVQSSTEDLEKTPVIVTETLVQGLVRRKISRTLSGSPAERQSSRKMFRNLSGSPIIRSSSVVIPRSPSKSPILRSSNLRSASNNSSSRNSRTSIRNSTSSQKLKAKTSESRTSIGNRTVTIKKESTPIAASTFLVMNETGGGDDDENEKTPIIKEERFFRFSKTSTPAIGLEKIQKTNTETNEDIENTKTIEESIITNGSSSPGTAEEIAQNAEVPKKKRKVKKDKEVKENIEEVGHTMRITRTKSKAIKQMMEENETKQADLSAFAKKLLNKAKMTSVKKNQLAALLECNSSTPINGHKMGESNLPFGNLTTSKSKYHLLLSSSKKLKTPLATLPNSTMKIAKGSSEKDKVKASRDNSTECTVRSVAKPAKNDVEKEVKIRSKKEKEEEAAMKRQNVIKSKQEELRRKNELKHQMAMKQREKLEQEKYHNMIQSEKEKEERHKFLLKERQIKLKEEAFKKKMLTQQKIAETVERRRLEEEARMAKLKEMEAEEQRLAWEKQKEQERQEKRAQERLAQKKAREEYEIQVKQEQEAERLRAEKLLTAKKGLPSAIKFQSASKRQKFGLIGEKREWDYKPRNENDYGLDEEHSEVDSEDEKSDNKAKPPVLWGKKIMHGHCPTVKVLTLEMLCEFMPCYQKSPDIHKMFKMTPSKRIKRTSSAIWNTPSS